MNYRWFQASRIATAATAVALAALAGCAAPEKKNDGLVTIIESTTYENCLETSFKAGKGDLSVGSTHNLGTVEQSVRGPVGTPAKDLNITPMRCGGSQKTTASPASDKKPATGAAAGDAKAGAKSAS